MHAGVFWVSTVGGIHGPFFGKFLPLGSFGHAGYRSGLQQSSVVHPRDYQGFKDGSVPQGLLHSYWPWQVSPMRKYPLYVSPMYPLCPQAFISGLKAMLFKMAYL